MNIIKKPVIGISIGDINGIGPEIIIKAFQDVRLLDLVTPIIYASSKIINYHRKAINAKSLPLHYIGCAAEAVEGKVNLVTAWSEEPRVELGKASLISGKCAFLSLQKLSADAIKGDLDGILTAPIHKKSIQSDEFKFPGHTEYFQRVFDHKKVSMLMVSEHLKVAVASGHLALKDVPKKLSEQHIIDEVLVLNESLKRDFLVIKPKIALLGLNPHSGEEGMLGMEEQEIIIPAMKKLEEEHHIQTFGPFPGDGYFGTKHFTNFDATLAMYHDQGLIPFKALTFNEGINYTAGLKVPRTSPDHGTGFNIAGKGLANPQSFLNALFLLKSIHKSRMNHDEAKENPLKPKARHQKER